MAKISTLHINNFKFFGESEPIDVGGKHLLIYGENGSGKSSIYWALYTLLEATFKSDIDIKKYFNKENPKNLINIYSNPVGENQYDSFVSILLDNNKRYKISSDDLLINDDVDSKESRRASDFLTYRFAYKIHDFKHGKEIEIFQLFLEEIFPYIVASKDLKYQKYIGEKEYVTRILSDAWTLCLSNGLTRYNNANKQRVRSDTAKANPYKDLAKDFDSEVLRVLTDIILIGNQLLERLDYNDIKFTLDYSAITFDKYGDAETPTIKLRVTEFAGQKNPFAFPQSFLNEARLTAIALAIRLGFLESRLSTAELKLLVLDDLLISLDMSNRRKVLDLLLTQYAMTYQLFILTHDRSFFEFAEKKIRVEYGQKESWEFVEMYQDTSQPIPRPYIAKKKSNLKRAEDYFKEYDYPACGLYLRRDCEKLLGELLPDKYKFVINNDGQSERKDLNGLINSLEEFCDYEGIDYKPFKSLKIYKDVILNTLAHNDAESPLYYQEMKAVLESVHLLDKIKRGRLVIGSGKDISFRLTASSGSTILVSLRTRESFVLVEEEGQPIRLSNFGKCEVRKVDRGTGWLEEEQGYNDIKSLIDFYKQQMAVTDSFDLLDLLDYRGNTLRAKLIPPAAPVAPAVE